MWLVASLTHPQPVFPSLQSFHPPRIERHCGISSSYLQRIARNLSSSVWYSGNGFTRFDFFFGLAGVDGAFDTIKELRLIVHEGWGCGDGRLVVVVGIEHEAIFMDAPSLQCIPISWYLYPRCLSRCPRWRKCYLSNELAERLCALRRSKIQRRLLT